jgi:uncharacterized protein
MDVKCNSAKAMANLMKHGVSFADAEAVLWDPHALSMEDTDAGNEQRFIALGLDSVGRVLVVVYAWKELTSGLYQREKRVWESEDIMRSKYDFSKAKRGAVISDRGKERITIFLDKEVVSEFRERAEGNSGDSILNYDSTLNTILSGIGEISILSPEFPEPV